MDLLLSTHRCSNEGGAVSVIGFCQKSKNSNAFRANDWHCPASSLRTKPSSLPISLFRAFVLLLPLILNQCSGFVVGEQRNYRNVYPSVESSFSGYDSCGFPRTLLFATKTEPTWREKLYSGRAILDRSENYPLEERLVFVNDEADTKSDQQDDVDTPCSSFAESGGDGDEASMDESDDDLITRRKQAAARAVLLAKGASSRSATILKQTSVGARKIGSAISSRRQGVRATNKILDVLRKTAQGTTSEAAFKDKREPSTTASARVSLSIIHTAIEEIIRSRDAPPRRPLAIDDNNFKFTAAFSSFGRSIGILGNSVSSDEMQTDLRVQSELLMASESTDQIAVRLATPFEDVDIASLRLSVFSDFPPDLQTQFCARSCQAIAARRMRGATCIVATQPFQNSVPGSRSSLILGSAECSFHEFFGTRLGRRRKQNSILYITEVAVNPSFRRRGIGSTILRAIDILAERRGVETMYLHVDVENQGALKMYEKVGYHKVLSTDAMFLEFTTSLNLHPGATRGREHFLLYKNLKAEPIWLDDREEGSASCRAPLLGGFGIEIPA